MARLATSRFVADPVLLKEVAMVLEGTKFDVIQFNNGMHGWQHSESIYGKAFPFLLAAVKSNAPQAKLIWASTTPLRDGKGIAGDTKAEYSNERIEVRNALAAEVVIAAKIPINDLFTPMRRHPELHSDNVHFNSQGIQAQAELVAAAVEKLLPQ